MVSANNRRRITRAAYAGFAVATAFSSCTALIEVPGGTIDVSGGTLLLDIPGVNVTVSDDRLIIDAPGFNFDFRD